MEEIYELLKYTIPALVVFAVAFLIMKRFLDNEYRKLLFELKRSNMKVVTPIRFQAYERAALFLERMSMEQLVRRLNKKGMTAADMQTALIQAIRSEYEHNLSQQIYIGSDAWDALKMAKEETVKVVHLAATKIQGKGTALDLTKEIFIQMEALEDPPNQKALAVIKKEVRYLF